MWCWSPFLSGRIEVEREKAGSRRMDRVGRRWGCWAVEG